MDEVKATITLRSGKELEQLKSNERKNKKREQEKENLKIEDDKIEITKVDNFEEEKEENSKAKMNKDMLLAPPFPMTLQLRKEVNNAPNFFEILKQVKVNLPFFDMIGQPLAYVKFLKDLCIIKRGMHLKKKVFLTEQVSTIIECKTLIKYKDMKCPTISVKIDNTFLKRTLLDLRASVNLLPYSVYKQMGLGELRSTFITLSLADRSVKFPKGIIEDMLIQIDRFYYPIDFVVLDMEQGTSELNHVPIILGQPFLTITNAFINC